MMLKVFWPVHLTGYWKQISVYVQQRSLRVQCFQDARLLHVDLNACHSHLLPLITAGWAISCLVWQKTLLCHTQISFIRKARELDQIPVWKLPLLYVWDRRKIPVSSVSCLDPVWNKMFLKHQPTPEEYCRKMFFSLTQPRQLHYYNSALHTELIKVQKYRELWWLGDSICIQQSFQGWDLFPFWSHLHHKVICCPEE